MSATLTESAASAAPPTPAESNAALEYRALYSGALIAALLGLCSLFMLAVTDFIDIALAVAVIPLLGIVFSLAALRKISKQSNMYTGKPFAWFGLALSTVMLCWGVGRAGYIHATEVPDGYQRISFLTLKPDAKDTEAGRPVPNEVIEVWEQSQPVFLKGYIRPGSTDSRSGATQFLLVRDNNQCCFGDLNSVKYFDQVFVSLDEGLTANADLSVTRVGGRLECIPQHLGRGPEYPVYVMKADYIE